jgi:hypothetical protein
MRSMQATGIIFAGLDCDADSIEDWNYWYDLEHVPPNVAMPGVMLGRRYVATPDLHALRIVDPSSGFANRRGTFLTIYTLCSDPAHAFDDMTVMRDKLYEGNRMTFPAEKKAVREGDVMPLRWALADPSRSCIEEDVPFVGHTSLLVVQRRGSDAVDTWYRTEWAPKVVTLSGVHGVMSCSSATRDDLAIDLVLLEGDAAEQTRTVRAAAPHHPEATIVLDTTFSLIDPLRYQFADAIRASDLPKTVA